MTTPRTGISRVLIANRGEIAVRIAQVCRELGMQSVAIYSEADRDLPHVHAADRAVPIGGFTPAESYLNAAAVLAAAALSGADAVHPGYGFLSESPDFAEAVMAAGLVWVGPSPSAMRAMALKVQARGIAEAAGVPVVPGAKLPNEFTADQLRNSGTAVGFPLLVKASAGGGGRGMRVVSAADELVAAVESAQREAISAFGDGTVFLERYLTNCRHVEVQVFGDTQGTVLHIGERECSVQRRHQKVVEECPSPGITETTRHEMLACAVSLARAINYSSAGTVEFIVSGEGDSQTFYFLEMNTRLQVEHPVTEAVFDVPLIEWQLRVASGEPLLVTQDEIEPLGHAIEVRLYAEDPANAYAPSPGVLHRFAIDDVRVDAGFEQGSEVSTYYDPMLAKVVAHAPLRREASLVLARALRGAIIHGPVTNRDLLVAVLESDDFLAGNTHTSFLDEHPHLMSPGAPSDRVQVHLAAAVVALAHRDRQLSLPTVPSGWRNVRSLPQARAFRCGDRDVTVAYARERDGGWRVGTTSSPVPEIGIATIEWMPSALRVSVNEVDHDVVVDLEGDERIFARVVCDSTGVVSVHDGLWNSRFVELARFVESAGEGALGASSTPVPGTVVLVAVALGEHVEAGQTLVVLEAMKMEHRIVAAADGVVTAVHVEVGQSVDAHAVVVTVSSDE